MLEEDGYPPYPSRPRSISQYIHETERREHRRDRIIVIICGFVAGIAIGGLIVAYGVF